MLKVHTTNDVVSVARTSWHIQSFCKSLSHTQNAVYRIIHKKFVRICCCSICQLKSGLNFNEVFFFSYSSLCAVSRPDREVYEARMTVMTRKKIKLANFAVHYWIPLRDLRWYFIESQHYVNRWYSTVILVRNLNAHKPTIVTPSFFWSVFFSASFSTSTTWTYCKKTSLFTRHFDYITANTFTRWIFRSEKCTDLQTKVYLLTILVHLQLWPTATNRYQQHFPSIFRPQLQCFATGSTVTATPIRSKFSCNSIKIRSNVTNAIQLKIEIFIRGDVQSPNTPTIIMMRRGTHL